MVSKSTAPTVETGVLLRSRRRCAICFGLHRDTNVKRGQITYLDHDNTNSNFANLAFLCLEHHAEYDSKASQSKGITEREIMSFRGELYEFAKSEKILAWADYLEVETGLKPSERPKLSPEAYELKIKVYRTVKDFLNIIMSEATISREQLQTFVQDTDEAIFLFDKELTDYLRQIYRKAFRLYYANRLLNAPFMPIEADRNKLADEHAELLKWFGDQFEIMREVFSKYIALG